ncbi:MAG TPA: hypothetical protein EYH50_01120 [Pyrodictium delaneyi]|uniref:Uncharacterized protein n=1 Tax=Pyrodictium delaneyi TaxID=1273541 RepID=A0A832ZSC0_9CREN|nr:hypothetical protein [Pyrodictium delaneyi]
MCSYKGLHRLVVICKPEMPRAEEFKASWRPSRLVRSSRDNNTCGLGLSRVTGIDSALLSTSDIMSRGITMSSPSSQAIM